MKKINWNFHRLILLFLFFLLAYTEGHSQNFRFWHLSTENGLSNSDVNTIFQDSQGFMWFGTVDGLNRYDGYEMKIYRKNMPNTEGLNSNFITTISEDKLGNIWIGNQDGLAKYNRNLDKFEKIKSLEKIKRINTIYVDTKENVWFGGVNDLGVFNPNTNKWTFLKEFADENINSITQTSQDDYWIASFKNGLYHLHLPSNKITKYQYNPQDKNSISNNFILKLYFDKNKNFLWIATAYGGISRMDVQSKQFRNYLAAKNDKNTILFNYVRDICPVGDRLLFAVENGGVSVYDYQSDKFSNYLHDEKAPYSVGANSIWAIYRDKQNRVWVGTYGQGLSIWDSSREIFTQSNIPLPNSIVNAVLKDSKNRLWVGTEEGVVVQDGAKITHFKNEANIPHSLSANPVLRIFEDTQNNIWLGTWMGGVNLFEENSQTFRHFKQQHLKNDNQLLINCVFALENFTDNQQVIVGSYGGVNLIKQSNKEWESLFDYLKINLKIDYLTYIFKDSKKNIWFNSYNSLHLIDNQGNHKNFMNVANDTNSLASSATHSTFEDSQNRIWIGTRDGISLLLPNGKFKNYTTKNGLPNNAINGILEDKKGNLWITTNQGLSKFNPQNQTFTNYFESDGLTSSQFKINSVFKDKKGYMYLGTIKGLNVFHPDSIQSNPHLPNVYLTDFKIFNKSVKIGEFDSLLTKVIGQTQTITLTYQHSVFSFDFVALNFTHSEKNQYAYIMEGFEKEWNYVGHQRTATYTNLDAGTYTFRVKASNNDGVWNEKGISIKIIILPPWWETWWFRTLLIGSIILGAFLFYRWRVRAIEAQKNRLEKLVEERTFELKEKNNEVSQQAEELMQQAEELLTQRDFIQAQNQQLAIQNQLVEEKNQQIRQSINAALTIQKAILPHQKKLEHLLGEHFVLYNPKDVVSGDFYWLHQIENKTIVVVADCTGHGVPGAFMTLIGNSLLDKIVRVLKITDPAEILTQLHQEVFRSLKQKYTGNNYGMDAIALCIDKMDENQPKITFSGAKNSIYIVDGIDNQNVKILKGSRRAIGGQQNASIPFDNQVVSLHQGSLVYLGSDGFIDQNNPRRKRFGSDKFVQLIKSYADKGLDEQAQLFKQALEQHMQDTHQRDDILLMGFKV